MTIQSFVYKQVLGGRPAALAFARASIKAGARTKEELKPTSGIKRSTGLDRNILNALSLCIEKRNWSSRERFRSKKLANPPGTRDPRRRRFAAA